jgi:chemotaxis protein methyltransferase CheR
MDEFMEFMRSFHKLTGIDLTLYKRPQMERRLTSLRNRNRYANFPDYLQAMGRDRNLLYELLDKMTINVSEFFRNPDRWELLVPILKELTEKGPLHAWSAACSTGEEPYSLSMIMMERVKRPYQILATDIDENVLETAKRGVYRDYQTKAVPRDLLAQYFTKQDALWSVKESVKQHVTFRIQNLLADAYPQNLDLVICRNVMIYFTEEAKQRVISCFAGALRPGGILFVGSTEQFLRTELHGLSAVGPFLYQKQAD